MIVQSYKGYCCRKVLLNTGIRSPTCFTLTTSLKQEKKLRAALPPSEAVAPLIFQFFTFSIWICNSSRQLYLLFESQIQMLKVTN